MFSSETEHSFNHHYERTMIIYPSTLRWKLA